MSAIVDERLRTIGSAFEPATDWATLSGAPLRHAIEATSAEPDEEMAYLVLAVMRACIPETAEVRQFNRRWKLEGLAALIDPLITRLRLASQFSRLAHVELMSGIVIDVQDTANSDFTTGIQRVARETLARWRDRPGVTIAVWSEGFRRLRPPTGRELERVYSTATPAGPTFAEAEKRVLIPFRAVFVLPEIAVDSRRAARIRAIVRYGSRRSVAIGYDCIPVTTAETAGPGMPGAFSRYLTALARFDAIAAISSAAQGEYQGWKRMLAGTGIIGPEVHEVGLPFDGQRATAEQVIATTDQLGLSGSPVILAVGSHEPRKNHLGLLHAAELVWREGHDFELVMVGGNSWGADTFLELVDELRGRGRRIVMLSGVDDTTIWSLYSIARASAFCSVNEGFGLPVVESLANGTPVITSEFGSMAELGDGHGALLVDPRDIPAMAQAITSLLTDDELHSNLVAQTLTVERTTWDEYAERIWSLVMTPTPEARA